MLCTMSKTTPKHPAIKLLSTDMLKISLPLPGHLDKSTVQVTHKTCRTLYKHAYLKVAMKLHKPGSRKIIAKRFDSYAAIHPLMYVTLTLSPSLFAQCLYRKGNSWPLSMWSPFSQTFLWTLQ